MAGFSGFFANLFGMQQLESKVNALETETNATKSVAMKTAPYRKVLTTNSSGVYTGALGGANTFVGEPVVQITPKSAGGSYDHNYSLSGDAVSGYSITVRINKRKTVISLIGSLLEAPESVQFSLSAGDQTT